MGICILQGNYLCSREDSMKIVVIVRTRDEEHNIDRFLKSYWWADQILIADACSDDNTVPIAQTYPNVLVRTFDKFIPMEQGLKRSPQGDHLNFLNDWAKEERADWIILDDCDCVPNKNLQEEGREILAECEFEFAYAVRLYLWKNNKYFPKMSEPIKKGKSETSLWAWKAYSQMTFLNAANTYTFHPRPKLRERLNIQFPSCLLHFSWVDEKALEKKLNYYRQSGQHPTIQHPLEHAGALKDLPEWAEV